MLYEYLVQGPDVQIEVQVCIMYEYLYCVQVSADQQISEDTDTLRAGGLPRKLPCTCIRGKRTPTDKVKEIQPRVAGEVRAYGGGATQRHSHE